MSYERYEELVRELCAAVGLPDAETVLQKCMIQVEGFDIQVMNFETDPWAIYLNFAYGVVPAGRTLRIWRLMLEANLSVYALDSAQIGMDAETGGILLILRMAMTPETTGEFLAQTISHYTEHGRFWQRSVLNSTDQMFESICSGEYQWIKA